MTHEPTMRVTPHPIPTPISNMTPQARIYVVMNYHDQKDVVMDKLVEEINVNIMQLILMDFELDMDVYEIMIVVIQKIHVLMDGVKFHQ